MLEGSENFTISIVLCIMYMQVNNSAELVRRTVYNFRETNMAAGVQMPSGVTNFDSYQDITDGLNHSIFLKHILTAQNKIVLSYVGFVLWKRIFLYISIIPEW